MEAFDSRTAELLVPLPSPDGDGAVELERLSGHVASLLERNAQLQRALDSRIVIEQAKGILAERLGITVDEAFALLREASRSRRTRIHKLAGAVVASRTTPAT
jgi:AmiR/NasT family two-component response regulator